MEILKIWHDENSVLPLLVKFVDSEGINHEIRLRAKQIQTFRQFQAVVMDKLGIFCQRDNFPQDWEDEIAIAFSEGAKE